MALYELKRPIKKHKQDRHVTLNNVNKWMHQKTRDKSNVARSCMELTWLLEYQAEDLLKKY